MDDELSKSGNRYFSGPKVGMTDLMVWPWMERMEALLSIYPSVDRKIPDTLTSLQSWMVCMRDENCIRQYGLTTAQHSKYFQAHKEGEVLIMTCFYKDRRMIRMLLYIIPNYRCTLFLTTV